MKTFRKGKIRVYTSLVPGSITDTQLDTIIYVYSHENNDDDEDSKS